MKKRVAIASRRVEGLSGAARMIIEHARRLAQAGWDVHVFSEKLDKKAIIEAGASVDDLATTWADDEDAFRAARAELLLYRD